MSEVGHVTFVARSWPVYLMLFYMSVGMLLPWNFFINVTGYWMYKFRTVNESSTPIHAKLEKGPDRNELQLEFTSFLSMAAMIPNVTCLALNGLFGHRFKTWPRLMFSLIGIILLFGTTLVFVKLNTDSWQTEFLYVTLAVVFLINIANGTFQGSFFGLVGRFPTWYMNAVLTGQGLGGVFAALINIVLLAVGGDDVDAALYCFLMSLVFLTGSLVALLSLARTDVYKQCGVDHYRGETDSYKDSEGCLITENTPLLKSEEQEPSPTPISLFAVMNKIVFEELSIFLIYVVTLCCFPALTVLVESTSIEHGNLWNDVYFVPVTCFLFYNVGDYLGRVLSAVAIFPQPGGKMCLFLAVLRMFFIPMFMICNLAPDSRQLTPVVFYSDTAYIVLVLALSISNGYLTSVLMVAAPNRVAGTEQETAANLMAGILGLGLAAGILFSQFTQL